MIRFLVMIYLSIFFYILNHSINFKSCEVTMSFSTSDRVHFRKMNLNQLINIVVAKILHCLED